MGLSVTTYTFGPTLRRALSTSLRNPSSASLWITLVAALLVISSVRW